MSLAGLIREILLKRVILRERPYGVGNTLSRFESAHVTQNSNRLERDSKIGTAESLDKYWILYALTLNRSQSSKFPGVSKVLNVLEALKVCDLAWIEDAR